MSRPEIPRGTLPARFEAALASLTEAQRLAVDSPAPALCVLAGAGSGKTRVLTLRVARRVQVGSAQADHSLVCTFTRRAADELRQRLAGFGVRVATPSTKGVVTGPGVRVGTLHQLALSLLNRHALDAGRTPPRVAGPRIRLLSELTGDPSLAAALDTEIGWAKARCLDPETYPAQAESAGRIAAIPLEHVSQCFGSYQSLLSRRNVVDLDDLTLRAAELIRGDSQFAEGVHWRYRHVSIDEFQDVNPAQYQLLEALSADQGDLLAVGDPNQAIYGWNGADPKLIKRLPGLVSGLVVLRLDDNHRSTPQVVAAATAALGSRIEGVPRSARPDGPMPVVTVHDDETAEADGVARRLLESSESGRRWSDHAILARTNDQLESARVALARSGIPFRLAPSAEAPFWTDSTTRNADAVELSTFHRAKGLEWQWVAVIGLEDGYVPISRAVTSEARDEERRLLYVALTRAACELHCSWARSRHLGGGAVKRSPSPWLAAVSEVSVAGSGRPDPVDAHSRIAQLRSNLSP